MRDTMWNVEFHHSTLNALRIRPSGEWRTEYLNSLGSQVTSAYPAMCRIQTQKRIPTCKMSFNSEMIEINEQSSSGARRDEPVADARGGAASGRFVRERVPRGRHCAPRGPRYIPTTVPEYWFCRLDMKYDSLWVSESTFILKYYKARVMTLLILPSIISQKFDFFC